MMPHGSVNSTGRSKFYGVLLHRNGSYGFGYIVKTKMDQQFNKLNHSVQLQYLEDLITVFAVNGIDTLNLVSSKRKSHSSRILIIVEISATDQQVAQLWELYCSVKKSDYQTPIERQAKMHVAMGDMC
ncbi:unnamed protein product [Caenorhabditis brenneri]